VLSRTNGAQFRSVACRRNKNSINKYKLLSPLHIRHRSCELLKKRGLSVRIHLMETSTPQQQTISASLFYLCTYNKRSLIALDDLIN
jgi:hypothetical protein